MWPAASSLSDRVDKFSSPTVEAHALCSLALDLHQSQRSQTQTSFGPRIPYNDPLPTMLNLTSTTFVLRLISIGVNEDAGVSVSKAKTAAQKFVPQASLDKVSTAFQWNARRIVGA
ncbi:unnamed protein product [Phytophthora fragariaefolia]|uniref:Unnamed protein product n=1 Tax=Phytophthora fragariaefolia TaxID=1490495 RepID=A0A9W6YH49_9STRA|nr:unnamed protein product [Phytophthora fragariaefolia]